MPITQKELTNLRTENSKTFELGGGKRQWRGSIGAIHYKENYSDESELWKPIDLTFENGRITKAPYILEINGLAITITSKRTGTLQTMTLNKIGVESPNDLLLWEFTGNSAILRNVAPDTDVVIEAGARLVRFKRILHSANAPLQADFIHSKVVGKADDIAIHTSARDADGEPLPVIATKVAGKLTETLDSKVELSKVKFPIEIDPTTTLQPADKDNYMAQNSSATNYGSGVSLRIQDTSGAIHRALLEFDISSIPAGAVLSAATLSLYWNGAYAGLHPSGKTVWAYKLTRTDWHETQSTWNIYKTGSSWTVLGGDYVTSSPSGGSDTFPAGAGWLDFNVLAIVQDAYGNSDPAEFLTRFATEPHGDPTWADFHSSEYTGNDTLRPKLVITYSTFIPTVMII